MWRRELENMRGALISTDCEATRLYRIDLRRIVISPCAAKNVNDENLFRSRVPLCKLLPTLAMTGLLERGCAARAFS